MGCEKRDQKSEQKIVKKLKYKVEDATIDQRQKKS